jgi:hypothetical protein
VAVTSGALKKAPPGVAGLSLRAGRSGPLVFPLMSEMIGIGPVGWKTAQPYLANGSTPSSAASHVPPPG